MLNVKNVSAFYDKVKIINNISFDVNKGENLCILGPNGCGKTTLLKTISGILPYEGRISINGKDINKMKRDEIATNIAVMSQISTIYFSYTVFETVLLGRYVHMKNNSFKKPSNKDLDITNKCLKAVGLLNYKDKQITTLSGGQLQRVYLARALAQEPNIILLDEPTNHLDLKHQTELIYYLKDWSKSNGHSVIGVLHDINLAMNLADKVLFLDKGNAAAYGKTEDIISNELLYGVYDMDVVSYMINSLNKWENISNNSKIIKIS